MDSLVLIWYFFTIILLKLRETYLIRSSILTRKYKLFHNLFTRILSTTSEKPISQTAQWIRSSESFLNIQKGKLFLSCNVPYWLSSYGFMANCALGTHDAKFPKSCVPSARIVMNHYCDNWRTSCIKIKQKYQQILSFVIEAIFETCNTYILQEDYSNTHNQWNHKLACKEHC